MPPPPAGRAGPGRGPPPPGGPQAGGARGRGGRGSAEGELKGLGELSRFTKEEMDGLIQRKWRERRPEQKVVSSAEVRGCLEEGWEFVTWLDQGRGEAVVRRPR